MAYNIMMCLVPLSALLLGSIYLWAIYHSIKTRAWKQIAAGALLGLVSAFVGGWNHPLAYFLLPLLCIGSIHIIMAGILENPR